MTDDERDLLLAVAQALLHADGIAWIDRQRLRNAHGRIVAKQTKSVWEPWEKPA